MGPNPHEQRGLEAIRLERAERLHRPWGRQMSDRSRRIAAAVVIAILIVLAVLVVVGWLNLAALRPPA